MEEKLFDLDRISTIHSEFLCSKIRKKYCFIPPNKHIHDVEFYLNLFFLVFFSSIFFLIKPKIEVKLYTVADTVGKFSAY